MAVKFPLLQLGQLGETKDLQRSQLGPQVAWTMRNVRHYRGKLETSPGVSTFIATVLAGRPLKWLRWLHNDGTEKLNVVTNTKIYKLNPDSGAVADITRAAGDYTGSVDDLWEAVNHGNLGIFTNGKDPVQKWDGVAGNCVDLLGTPPKGRAMATFLTYLVFSDIDPYGTPLPRLVQWSDDGNPEQYGSGDAGSLNFYQRPGRTLRVLPLGDVLVFYREQSTHVLFFIGPPFVFAQRELAASGHLIAPRAVVDIGQRHVLWGTDDFYLFDGSERRPIGGAIFEAADKSFERKYQNAILAIHDEVNREVLFAHPIVGAVASIPEHAWVYSYHTNTWREEDISATASGVHRRLSGGASWNSIATPWNDQTRQWDEDAPTDKSPIILIATSSGDIQFIDINSVNIINNTRERVYESGLFSPGLVLFEDADVICELTRLEVDFEAVGTHNIDIGVGTQMQLIGDDSVAYTSYTIPADGSQRKVDVRLNGRYFALRIRTTGSSQKFRGSGITAYFERRGYR